MEKFKKKVILGSIGFGIATGAVIGTALTFHYLKKANSNETEAVLNRARKFEFKINSNHKDFDISSRYASEFAYISFFGYSKKDNEEPTLKTDKEYWKALETKIFSKNKTPFLLFSKEVNYTLEDLTKDHFIYYHSYADDYDGTLYLRVYFEKKPSKNASLVSNSEEYAKRKANWKWVDYQISGFKKVDTSKNQAELLKNYSDYKHGFRVSSKLKNKLLKKEINSFEDVLDSTGNDFSKLPMKKQDSAESIEKAHKIFSDLLDYNHTVKSIDNANALNFSIDSKKPIYITKSNNNEYNVHYSLFTYVPNAQFSDEGQLNSAKKVDISKEFTAKLQVKHSELTEALNQIEIKDLKGNNESLKDIIPSSLKYNTSSSAPNDSYHNTTNGYIELIDLLWKNSAKQELKNKFLSNEYTVSYHKISENDGVIKEFSDLKQYFKKDNKTDETVPFVNLDDSKGETIIAVKITAKLENGYTESIIGTLKLTGLKKSSSSASSTTSQ